MRQSLHTIFWSLASRIITFSLILIQGVFVARLLGPEGKGLQAKVMTTVSLIVVLFDFGLSNSINYFVGQKSLNRENLVRSLFIILGGQTFLAVATLALMIFTPLRDLILRSENQTWLVWAYLGGTALLDLFRLSVSSVLSAHLKFSWLNRVDLGSAMARLCGYAVVFYFRQGQADSIWFIFGVDLAVNFLNFCTLSIAFVARRIQFHAPVAVGGSFALFSMFAYSTPIFLSNILNYFNTRLDFWVIERRLGLENLGYYAMASTGAQLLSIIPSVFGSVIFSYLNQMAADDQRRSFETYSRLNFTVVLVGVICAELLSSVLIPILYGQKFSNSIPLFQLMLVTTLLQSFRYLLGIFCQATNRNKLRLRSDLISAGVNVILLYFAIEYFGMIGVIATLAFSQLVGCVDMMMNLKMSVKNPVPLLVLRRQDLALFQMERENT